MDFYGAFNGSFICTFRGQLIVHIFSALTTQLGLPLRRMLDVYTRIIKCNPLCCNYIEIIL